MSERLKKIIETFGHNQEDLRVIICEEICQIQEALERHGIQLTDQVEQSETLPSATQAE